jgi:hypothetical protein
MMPDEKGNTHADTPEGKDTATDTSLHAYREGREEDIKGDTAQILSNDPDDQQRKDLAGPGEDLGPDKH